VFIMLVSKDYYNIAWSQNINKTANTVSFATSRGSLNVTTHAVTLFYKTNHDTTLTAN